MIQESVFGKACAQNFDQAKPVQKWLPIRNRGHFLQIESLGCGRSQKPILESFSVYGAKINAQKLVASRDGRDPVRIGWFGDRILWQGLDFLHNSVVNIFRFGKEH